MSCIALLLLSALAAAPPDANSFFQSAQAKEAQGDLEGAILDYSKAIRLSPRYTAAYNNRGNSRRKNKDYDGAMEDYLKALELDPQDHIARCNLGVVKNDKGD